jgi:integrin alpha FG-GAP repeat containing protein 1
VLDTTHSPPLPIPLKIGDANLDGFPDILLITASGKTRTPKLLWSVPCASGVSGCGADGSGHRGWKLATKDVDSLATVTDARSVSFVDLDEDVSHFVLILEREVILTADIGYFGHYGSKNRGCWARQCRLHSEQLLL